MIDRQQYTPGPASAEVQKHDGDQWGLVLVRELRHSPEKVWQAITDPAQMREWAPFEVEGNLGSVGGKVKLTWAGTTSSLEATVMHAEAPELLEYGDFRWELEPAGRGTRLTLRTRIDRRYISMGAAGWHISLDVLDHLLAGNPIGRIAGGDAMKFAGWQRLNGEYAELFGVQAPSWPKG